MHIGKRQRNVYLRVKRQTWSVHEYPKGVAKIQDDY